MNGPGDTEITSTGKPFEVDFCTVARWDNGEIVEENVFCDVVGLMSQIGLASSTASVAIAIEPWARRTT